MSDDDGGDDTADVAINDEEEDKAAASASAAVNTCSIRALRLSRAAMKPIASESVEHAC